MAIKTRNRHMVQHLEWKTNGQALLELPQDNPVRRVNLHGVIKITTGSTAGTGIKNGGLLNLIKRIQVRLNGHDNIFDVDLRTYFEALTFEYGTKPFISSFSVPSASSAGTFYFEIPIDFALIRHQISDFSALVPAHALDSFELIVDFGAIGDVITTANNTAVTDADSRIDVSIIEVYGTDTAQEMDDILGGLTKVYEGVEQTEIDSAHTSYPADELPVQIRPVPARHLSALLVALKNVTDSNPANADDVITQVKIENVKGGGESIFHEYWKPMQRMQKLDYRLESDNITGSVYFDWVDQRNGGLSNISVDALKYKFLTNAPASNKKNAIRIYKKFIPVG